MWRKLLVALLANSTCDKVTNDMSSLRLLAEQYDYECTDGTIPCLHLDAFRDSIIDAARSARDYLNVLECPADLA